MFLCVFFQTDTHLAPPIIGQPTIKDFPLFSLFYDQQACGSDYRTGETNAQYKATMGEAFNSVIVYCIYEMEGTK